MTSVAGDFYDFIIVGEKHVGILVADGHGSTCGSYRLAAKIARVDSIPALLYPGRVLAGLNQSLCGKFKHHFADGGLHTRDMEKEVHELRRSGTPATPTQAHINSERSEVGDGKSSGSRPRSDSHSTAMVSGRLEGAVQVMEFRETFSAELFPHSCALQYSAQ